jgi:hypothetical protein
MVISQTEAETILRRDVSRFEDGVLSAVKVTLTQGQFDALVSFAFNVGMGALGKSTLLKKLNAGRYRDVPAELMKWTNGGGRELAGLVRRRREEAALWRNVSATATAGKADIAKVDPPKPPKTMAESKTGNTAIGVGAGGAIVIASQAKDVAEAVKGVSESLGVSVAVILGIALIAAAVFLWWDRRRKLYDEGI